MLTTALAEAARVKATRIARIKLKVGAGTSVVPDCLQFYFRTLRAGTIADQAELEIETVPLVVRCPRCGRDYPDLAVTCDCREGVTLVSGEELLVEYLEVE